MAAGCLAERYGAQLAEELPEAEVLSFEDYANIDARLDAVLAGQRRPAHQQAARVGGVHADHGHVVLAGHGKLLGRGRLLELRLALFPHAAELRIAGDLPGVQVNAPCCSLSAATLLEVQ